MSSFSQIAGIHASKAEDLLVPPDEDQATDEQIADALLAIAHSLIALTLLQLGDWDRDSFGYEDFTKGFTEQ